jgi:hypothetical protein
MSTTSATDTPDMIHIEVDIERAHEAEFREMLTELVVGRRPRSAALAQETEQMAELAIQALDSILEALLRDPATGRAPGPRQCRRLVRFLAALCEPARHQLDLSDLRAMDPVYSRACIDCLNYFRLGLQEASEWRPDARETIYLLFDKYLGAPS